VFTKKYVALALPEAAKLKCRTTMPNVHDIAPSLVSVILPTFNRARAVAKAIDSILRQTHQRLEVIVVDDGSTDETRRVLEDVIRKDSRASWHSNRHDKGCAGARNTGISLAKGEYVAFLDDDDEYEPEKIAKQLDAFHRHPCADVVISGVRADWCDKPSSAGWVSLEFHPNQIFDGCNLMCKMAVLEDVTLRCNYMEWRDFAFQVYDQGYVVLLTSERLVRKTSTSGSLSTQKEAMYLSALGNAKLYYQRTQGKQEHPVFRHYLANCSKTMGNFRLKRGRIGSAIVYYANSFWIEKKIKNLIPFA
jgi:glycosyltransferase involved in cell wall biosynthesis